jgi:N-acetylated-alpha-linked acidic dipeptidase
MILCRLTVTIAFCSLFALQALAQMTGFSSQSAEREAQIEQKLIANIRPDSLKSIVKAISKDVHVAGTPAQAITRDYVIKRWKRAGLDTKAYPYSVYIPHATKSTLTMIAPKKKVFDLHEGTLGGEGKTKEYPWANGYSAAGTVTADLIYVNYGLFDDYHLLDSLGISVRGKIVIARYGKSYRGIKAMLAERNGAAGLILFSDPSGDGYDDGDMYPAGPMRPWNGIQRGSIYNGHGDPTTPGYSSTPGAWHSKPDSVYDVPNIPVIPISYGIANDLLSVMKGHDIPNRSWQGGLPFRYHVGNDAKTPVRVTLSVATDLALKPIWNTVGMIKGSTWQDEWVIVGGHRDAWCYGAEDNASGAASVVAAAEACAALTKEGMQPKRSMLFVTWDAEEWGLIGSTEFVEQLEKELGAKAVAYINQDECATGSDFSASADPSLRSFVYEVSKALPDGSGQPIYSAWAKKNDNTPNIGLLGGGSDFSPFYNHLGIPSLEHGFGGPFGQYHSMHDNIQWTLHFGDSTFASHAASSQFAAVEAMRLANADLLPYNFVDLATWLGGAVQKIKSNTIKQLGDSSSIVALENAIGQLNQAATDFERKRSTRLRSNSISENIEVAMNAQLRKTYFAFTSTTGLFFDKWEHNMLVLSDPDNGYADVELPAISLAIRRMNPSQVTASIYELSSGVQQATELLRALTKQLTLDK